MDQQQKPGGSDAQVAALQTQLAQLSAGGFNAEWAAQFDLKEYKDGRNTLGKPSDQAVVFKGEYGGLKLAIRKIKLKHYLPPDTDKWGNPAKERKLMKELELWRKVSGHPLVVPVLSWTVAYSSDGTSLNLYSVMPQIDGETLEARGRFWNGQGSQMGGLLAPEDKAQWKTLNSELILAVAYLHQKGIAHCSLHHQNVMLAKVPKKIDEVHVKIIDFGRAKDLGTLDAKAATKAKAEDVKRIAMLHVYAVCGFYCGGRTLPKNVMDRAFPKVQPADMGAEEWEQKKRERLYVLGVLEDVEGHLAAHQLICFPHFEGAEANGKPLWTKTLEQSHPFAATGASLYDKYKAGNGALKLRDQAAQELEHFSMEAVTGYARCDAYPSFMPIGYACASKRPTSPRPTRTALPEPSIKHAHAADGKPFVTAAPRALNLSENATKEQKDLLKLTAGNISGRANYLFTPKVVTCDDKAHWLNVRVGNFSEKGGHFFVLRHDGCDQSCNTRAGPIEFSHLSQFVQPVKVRSDRVESWTTLVTHCSDILDPIETKVGKLLAPGGMTWVEPTYDNFKQLGTAAEVKEAKKSEDAKNAAEAKKPAGKKN